MHTLQELVYIHALINASYPDIDYQIIATACMYLHDSITESRYIHDIA